MVQQTKAAQKLISRDKSPPITVVEHRVVEAVAALQLHIPTQSLIVITECASDERYGKRAGQISIPMGKIEDDEADSADIKQSLLRELWQETGLTGEIQAYIGRFGVEVDGTEKAMVAAYLMKPLYGPRPLLANMVTDVKNPQFIAVRDFLAMYEQARPPSIEIVGRGLQILEERLDIRLI